MGYLLHAHRNRIDRRLYFRNPQRGRSCPLYRADITLQNGRRDNCAKGYLDARVGRDPDNRVPSVPLPLDME